MLMIALKNNLNVFGNKKDRKLLLIRGMTGTMGLMCAYVALSLLTPSDFSAIVQSNVVITAIFARIFLKEKLTLAHFVSVLLTCTGVLLISQPSFIFKESFASSNESNVTNSTSFQPIKPRYIGLNTLGLIVALCDAFLWSGSQIIVKKLCNKKVHFSINAVYTSYIGLPLSLILSCILVYTGHSNLIYIIRNDWLNFKWNLFYCLCVSTLGVGNMIIINFAMELEEASKIAIIKTTDLFFIFALQYFFLNIQSDYLNVIGAFLILLSVLLLFIYRLLDQSNTKKISLEKHDCIKDNKHCLKKFYITLKNILFHKF
jgi:drug/metabolite transporter (DMT)-like permease